MSSGPGGGGRAAAPPPSSSGSQGGSPLAQRPRGAIGGAPWEHGGGVRPAAGGDPRSVPLVADEALPEQIARPRRDPGGLKVAARPAVAVVEILQRPGHDL